MKKLLEEHLKTLWTFQQHLFEQGHTFWHCDAQDEAHNKPFYYYQINKSRNMSTCSTCYQLMENRRKIRAIERQLGLPLTPFITSERKEEHIKRMSVSSSSEWNPNYRYL
jgi:hypothetical protein